MKPIIDLFERNPAGQRRSETGIGYDARTAARRRLWIWGLATGLTSFLLMPLIGSTSSHAQPEPPSCTDATPDCRPDIRRITIGPETFDIPASHFHMVPPDGHEGASALLFLAWPNLTWDSRGEMLAALMTPGTDERINLLIHHNPNREGAFKRVFRFSVSPLGEQTHELVGDHFGLEQYLRIGRPRTFGTREVYAWPSAQNLLVLIRCLPEDAPEYSPIVNPSCRHFFYHLDLTFTLTYRRHQLPEWQEIQTSVEDLFSEYRVEPPMSPTLPQTGE